jgi:hypothetical protein
MAAVSGRVEVRGATSCRPGPGSVARLARGPAGSGSRRAEVGVARGGWFGAVAPGQRAEAGCGPCGNATVSSSLFLFRPAHPRWAPPSCAGGGRPGARAHPAEAGAKLRPCHPKRDEQRRTEGCECLFDRDPADVRERKAHYWKISVVQSPPWRRTSWARAGPSGRSWKSMKKSGSTSIPPSGSQLTLRSHERSSG